MNSIRQEKKEIELIRLHGPDVEVTWFDLLPEGIQLVIVSALVVAGAFFVVAAAIPLIAVLKWLAIFFGLMNGGTL